jgi:AhpD family alkylhydroperoxidase
MKRQEIYKEIENTWGTIPVTFKKISDSSLEFEWRLMKLLQMEPGPIPNKYRALMGLAMATAARCRYCTLFHTEMAKLNGATDAEIEDAMHISKTSAGWSAYLNDARPDFDQFKEEILSIVQHAGAQVKK